MQAGGQEFEPPQLHQNEALNMPNEFDFSFDEVLLIEPVYEPPDIFLNVFYEFDYRLQSLQRYYAFTSKYVDHYLAGAQNSLEQYNDPSFLAKREKLYEEAGIGGSFDPGQTRQYFGILLIPIMITLKITY